MIDLDAQYGRFARWYDALYEAAGKDPAVEAAALLALVEERGVRVRSLLDVACGTGAHLARFADDVPSCTGVDVAPGMLAVAAERLGDRVELVRADMVELDLGRTFDVVTCLFSAIGHVPDEDGLDEALTRMAGHVAPGGLLLVEPWLTPDAVNEPARSPDGYRSLDVAETDDGTVARVCRSHVEDDRLVVHFGWAVADTDGVETREEVFRMPLFTRERYLSGVRRAGLAASWVDSDALWTGRGLLVGERDGA